MARTVLAFDLGGTKCLGGIVDSGGQILKKEKIFLEKDLTFESLIDSMTQLGKILLADAPLKSAAIAAAGPLDPQKGLLLNPTNLTSGSKRWGEVPLAPKLSEKLGLTVALENDAAAAALASHWLAEGKNHDNLLVLTLGTGLGVGVIANGQLVRSGRFLHPEAGHIPLYGGELGVRCGCGNYGCAEAYLSGMHFARRVGEKMGQSSLRGEELLKHSEQNHPRVLSEWKDYARLFAQALRTYIILYAPEKIILTGGFAKATPYFLPAALDHLDLLFKERTAGADLIPTVSVSSKNEDLGLLGAARVALNQL